jgi:hypothetical protein
MTLQTAQFTIDDVEVVVALLDSSFNGGTPAEMRAFHGRLQAAAARAGMHGSVAAVWRDASGCTRFLASPEQHAFFQILSYTQIVAQANRTLELS